jgi:putative transcriptional regulator
MQSELYIKGGMFLKSKIQELRKINKISQEELAMAVGVTRQTITSLECEKYTASLVLAYKIARFFGTTIEDIFDFSDVEEII